jgi:NAD(P)-dependent dehydrogenase (short-subunit alcohol dehydrogenase family)
VAKRCDCSQEVAGVDTWAYDSRCNGRVQQTLQGRLKTFFERCEAAARTIDGDARALQLDVTDKVSIAAAAERIRKEPVSEPPNSWLSSDPIQKTPQRLLTYRLC